jgi:DNA-binding HxlR family transcriptional regulator
MVALDLLGRRSTLRILWELRADALTFRRLQEASETNSSLLNTRLAELRELGLVAHDGSGYALSAEGRRLLAALTPLTEWARRWKPVDDRESRGKR